MKLEDIEKEWSEIPEANYDNYEADEFARAYAQKLINVAKAAKEYIRKIMERRPEYVDYETLVCALDELEK